MNAFILHFELTRPRPWAQLWTLLAPWRSARRPAPGAGKRAIPTPSRALQALLHGLGPAPQGLGDLAAVARTLRLAGAHNPLAHLGADTLLRAMQQLEGLVELRHDAELALLHLQMHRRVEELRARAQAEHQRQPATPAK